MSTVKIIAIAMAVASIAFNIFYIIDNKRYYKERDKRLDALEESYRKRHDPTPQH